MFLISLFSHWKHRPSLSKLVRWLLYSFQRVEADFEHGACHQAETIRFAVKAKDHRH